MKPYQIYLGTRIYREKFCGLAYDRELVAGRDGYFYTLGSTGEQFNTLAEAQKKSAELFELAAPPTADFGNYWYRS